MSIYTHVSEKTRIMFNYESYLVANNYSYNM